MKFLCFRLEYFDDRVGRIATLKLNSEFMFKKFCPCSPLVFLEGVLKEFLERRCGGGHLGHWGEDNSEQFGSRNGNSGRMEGIFGIDQAIRAVTCSVSDVR